MAGLRPLRKKVRDALVHLSGARGNGRKQKRLRAALHQELPGMRRCGQILRHDLLGEVFGIIFKVAPAFDKAFVGDLLLDS